MTVGQVVGTIVATGVVGFLVWLATVPLRGSVLGLIASVVLTGPVAVLGGIAWALLLGPQVTGPRPALELALTAVVVAAVEGGVAATRAHRRFTRSQRALRASLDGLAAGSEPRGGFGRPLLSELEAVRADLSRLASDLQASRARDQALDESRRRLIAWVSQDLLAPLTVLRGMAEPSDGNVDDVRAELGRLVAVVDDLFDLATAAPEHTSGALVVPRWEPARLAEVLDDAVAALEPLVRLRDVDVAVRGTTSVQVRLVGAGGDDLGRRLLAALVDGVRRSRPGTTLGITVDLLDDVVVIDVHPGDDPAAVGAPVGPSVSALRLPVVVPA